ncbi:MAG: S1C family serine protease [Alphaproteobacteria bacterium]
MLGIESTNPRIKDYFNPQNPQQLSLGSGFIIDGDGYIITNNHVIDQAEEITVTLADNRQLTARLVGRDGKTDIALIKVEASEKLPAVKLGDSDKIRVGDWVLAIGNPFGLGGSVTAGIVSAKSRDIEAGPYDNFIQTDASINQGSSGGPMFNLDGEVIGINTAIFSTNGGSMGIGFAVPVNLTHFVIEQLKSKGKVERGWIGIKIQPNSGDIAHSLSQQAQRGVIVSSVSKAPAPKQPELKPATSS